VVTGNPDTLNKALPGKTKALVNEDQTITGHFIHEPDYNFHHETLKKNITSTLGKEHVDFIDASHIARRLLGDSIATNMFMMGYAYQKGLIPLSRESIEKTIEMNGVAVSMNIQAFRWGRYAALDIKAVEKAAGLDKEEKLFTIPKTLEEIITFQKAFLTEYQNKAYAERYEKLLNQVIVHDKKLKRDEFSKEVAKYYAKLLAIKDEYEVGRLFADGTFMKELSLQFEGPVKLKYYLAPPLIARRNPATGEFQKQEYGAWMMHGFRLLSKFKGLRGTVFDIFGYTKDRKKDRALIKEYEDLIGSLLKNLKPENYEIAVELASLPEHIRGYGHIKDRHLADVKVNEEVLLERFFNVGKENLS
jgi:indolepyruvate ferredoxin oxidoreductase